MQHFITLSGRFLAVYFSCVLISQIIQSHIKNIFLSRFFCSHVNRRTQYENPVTQAKRQNQGE